MGTISLKNVRKAFGEAVIIPGADLEIEHGEFVVFVGPSGCGKSTLLKAAAGFIPPREGSIRLDGQTIEGPGPDRIVVFQEFDQLPPWKTVLANVMFPLLATRRLGKAGYRELAEQPVYRSLCRGDCKQRHQH